MTRHRFSMTRHRFSMTRHRFSMTRHRFNLRGVARSQGRAKSEKLHSHVGKNQVGSMRRSKLYLRPYFRINANFFDKKLMPRSRSYDIEKIFTATRVAPRVL